MMRYPAIYENHPELMAREIEDRITESLGVALSGVKLVSVVTQPRGTQCDNSGNVKIDPINLTFHINVNIVFGDNNTTNVQAKKYYEANDAT